jgi:probable HAF family extracellular repeat protein
MTSVVEDMGRTRKVCDSRHSCLRALLSVALLLPAGPLIAQQQYQVKVLPPASTETTVPVGLAINSNGTVTGFLAVTPAVPPGLVSLPPWSLTQQPSAASLFQYTAGTTTDLGSYDPLNLGANYCQNTVSPTVGVAINANGAITGAICATTTAAQTFVYTNGGAITPITSLAPAAGSADLSNAGAGINSLGQIAGTLLAGTSSAGGGCQGGNEYHAFVYDTGSSTLQDLGTLSVETLTGTVSGCASYATAINDSGVIAGAMFGADSNLYAFTYSSSTGVIPLGDLADPSYTVPTAINANGQVTGFSNLWGGYGPAAFLYSNGQMQSLGTLGGYSGSQGNAINSAGQVTGVSFTADESLHAFIYTNGTMTDLNSLLSPSDAAQYTLVDAVAINDSGQIVVWGYPTIKGSSNLVTLLLTPVAPGAPTIAPQVSGPQGTNGWYTGDVSLSWAVDSSLPITAKTGCAAHTFSANTKGTLRTCTATNSAGTNSASETIMIDMTAPTVRTSASPGANAAGWNKGAVTLTFLGSDSTSGIKACTPPVVLSAEGTGQSASGNCTNNAGLASAVTSPVVNIDLTPPTTSVVVPANGATYAKKSSVLASYSCADALSGVASCTGTVATGLAIATGTAGTKTFTVTARDVAGNSTKTQVTYTVQ